MTQRRLLSRRSQDEHLCRGFATANRGNMLAVSSNWEPAEDFTPDRKPGRDLAEFVTQLRFEDLPSDVVSQARRVLLEGLSWLYLGSRRPEAAALRSALETHAVPGACTVAAFEQPVSASWAAYANGALAQIQDCNDGQRVASVYGASYHPGRIVVPTALAACQQAGAGGEELLTAIVAGYEVAGRIRGLDPRPPADAYASAAIASRQMNLGPARMLHAMGIAGHLASPITGADPYDVSFLTIGNIARLGIESAGLAEQGLTGPPLENDSRLSPRRAGEGSGEDYQILHIYTKPYIGCRLVHGAVEAALGLRAEFDVNRRDVDRIVVRVIPEAHYVTGHVDAASYYRTCQLSLAYCMACALIDGDVGEAQFTPGRIASRDVLDLHDRITVVTDESLDVDYPHDGRPTIVEVETVTGKILRWTGRYDKGEPENPLSDDELIDKFRRWAGPSLAEEQVDRLIELVWSVEDLGDLDPLARLLRTKSAAEG